MIGLAAENYFLCQQRQLYFFNIGALTFPQESVKVESNDICIILRNLFPDFLVMSDQGKMWLWVLQLYLVKLNQWVWNLQMEADTQSYLE